MSVNAYFAAGRVAVLSTKLWSKEKFIRLSECNNIEDALRILYENAYGGGAMLSGNETYEKLLAKELADSIAFLKEMTSNQNVSDCFLLPFDYLNAKLMMKSKYMQIEPDGAFDNSTIDKDYLWSKIVTDDYTELSQEMQQALNEIDLRFFEQGKNPRIIDTVLDKAMYKEIRRNLRFVTLKSIKKYFKYEIDSTNILALVRSKRAHLSQETYMEMTVEGGSIKPITLSEAYSKEWQDLHNEITDEVFSDLLKQAAALSLKGESLGECAKIINKTKRDILAEQKDSNTVETVICYYLSKITEIDNIRMILIGIKNNLSKDTIKEMIKELYA